MIRADSPRRSIKASVNLQACQRDSDLLAILISYQKGVELQNEIIAGNKIHRLKIKNTYLVQIKIS